MSKRSSPKKTKSSAPKSFSYSNFFKTCIIGAVINLILNAFIMFFSSFFLTFISDDPVSLINAAIIVCTVISSAISGYIAAASLGKRGLLCGLCAGAITSLMLLFVLIFTPDQRESSSALYLRIAVIALQIIISGISGSFASQKSYSSKSKHFRRSLRRA